jgi:hypothetical protein
LLGVVSVAYAADIDSKHPRRDLGHLPSVPFGVLRGTGAVHIDVGLAVVLVTLDDGTGAAR